MNKEEIINAQNEVKEMMTKCSYDELQLLLDKMWIMRNEIAIEMTKRDVHKQRTWFKWGGVTTAGLVRSEQ